MARSLLRILYGDDKMIKSMTGFGRCEVSEDSKKITVEMKSVNHRYLDLGIKMPKKLNAFEADIRALLKEYIQRGKAVSYTHLDVYKRQCENRAVNGKRIYSIR